MKNRLARMTLAGVLSFSLVACGQNASTESEQSTVSQAAAETTSAESGTADQHTSFSVGYNIGLAASMLGYDVDYHMVWNMGHGSEEGNSTGTFIDWINEICQ